MADLQMESQKPVPVIVIPITQEGWEWVGMLPESEVASNCSKNGKLPKGIMDVAGDADSLVGMDDGEDDEREDRNVLGEKRTRFSISQDDASIGKSKYISTDTDSIIPPLLPVRSVLYSLLNLKLISFYLKFYIFLFILQVRAITWKPFQKQLQLTVSRRQLNSRIRTTIYLT